MEHLKMHSINKVNDNIKNIGALFPNCVTESIGENGEVEYAIDFDMLKQELSTVIIEGKTERYQFTWPDKKQAVLAANAPISKTLRPCREESVDFDKTENLYIEGDNLEVLKLLQETYLGKIKMIYIDPPYNTGSDFVYEDDFAQSSDEYIQASGQHDESGNKLFQNTESNGRFHTDWLNMIYPRLKLAKDLLTEDGLIFISIDDNEQSNMRKVCDELFGASNFVTMFIWEKTQHFGRQKLNSYSNNDYILCYAKSLIGEKLKELLVESITTELQDAPLFNASNNINVLTFPAGTVKFNMKDGTYYSSTNPDYELLNSVTVKNGHNANEFSLKFRSRWSNKTVQEEIKKGTTFWVKTETFAIRAIYGAGKTATVAPKQIIFSNSNNPMCVKTRNGQKIDTSENATNQLNALMGAQVFSYPKPVSLIKYFISLLYNDQTKNFEDDFIVLDFFSGSATTAQAVMELNLEDNGNRKFILVQLDEDLDENLRKASNSQSAAIVQNAIDLCDALNKPHKLTEVGKERIRRAAKQIQAGNGLVVSSVDTGFRVLKCDTSNMKDVYYNPSEITLDMFSLLADNIKEDRTPEDLLFQVMLDLGVSLSSKITETAIADRRVFDVADGFLIACFDNNISEEAIAEIAKKQPYYFVTRDSSMANDSVATNFEQLFATYSPDTVRKVL